MIRDHLKRGNSEVCGIVAGHSSTRRAALPDDRLWPFNRHHEKIPVMKSRHNPKAPFRVGRRACRRGSASHNFAGEQRGGLYDNPGSWMKPKVPEACV